MILVDTSVLIDWRRFNVKDGLELLRNRIKKVAGTSDGILLIGDIGIASHFGDLLRCAQIPSRIIR